MVILDTSLIIDHLRQTDRSRSTRLLELAKKFPKEGLGLSVISVQELYEGASMAKYRNEQQALAIISSLRLLPYTMEVAQRAGELARNLPIQLDFADMAIAATCVVNQAQLATLNTKHFQKIPGLMLVG